MPKVLFVSGSIGLGHVTRDLAIAKELRRQIPGIELFWLAAHPATRVLVDAGEQVLPESDRYANSTDTAEALARNGFSLDLVEYSAAVVASTWVENGRLFAEVIRRKEFDLVVADEAYEIVRELLLGGIQMEMPLVALFDFFGIDSTSGDPVEVETTHGMNQRFWSQLHWVFGDQKKVAVFVGEPDDIPDLSLGPGLPARREYANSFFSFVGHVLPFDPSAFMDRSKVRAELGYRDEPLIVCSIGGTSVGKDLLDLCRQALPLIRQRIPDVRMVLVGGPKSTQDRLDSAPGLEVRGYIPQLYRHFAASDIAVVQGGGTSTIELTALKRPFIYFPLERHYEQQIHVAHCLRRRRAGVELSFSRTTPASLADAIVANIAKEVSYAPVSAQGARRCAEIVARLI